jgi:hypothetical protein
VNGLGLEKHIVNGLEAGPTQTIVVVLYNLNKHNKITVVSVKEIKFTVESHVRELSATEVPSLSTKKYEPFHHFTISVQPIKTVCS